MRTKQTREERLLKKREWSRKWRAENPQKKAKQRESWRQRNRDKTREYCRNDNIGHKDAKLRYKKWDIVDECKIFDKEKTDKELSIQLGRSVASIRIKRYKLLQSNDELSDGRAVKTTVETLLRNKMQ